MGNNLNVNVNSNVVGKLIHEKEEFIFTYDIDDKDSYISLTMPVRAKDYVHNKLFPIFEMHLPEGYLLSIIKKHFSKIAKTDDFGLLSLMSANIKGRLSYESSISSDNPSLTLDNLLHPQSETLFDELVSKFALTSALSGVQPKVLAKVQDKGTLLLQDYIVKSWGDDYPQLAINEYYCMQILKRSDINVPEFYLSDDHKLFIMKRFDMREDGSCLGFEDMCVLQAKQRDDKYEGTYEQIAKSIKTFVSAKNKKDSLRQFFKMIVINNLVQNGDAHLKNFGLIYEDISDIRLSPAFDVVCTTMYIKNDIPALHLLGSKKWWDKKYLIRFGTDSCALSAKEANDLFERCMESLCDVTDEIIDRLKIEKDEEVREILAALRNVFSWSL